MKLEYTYPGDSTATPMIFDRNIRAAVTDVFKKNTPWTAFKMFRASDASGEATNTSGKDTILHAGNGTTPLRPCIPIHHFAHSYQQVQARTVIEKKARHRHRHPNDRGNKDMVRDHKLPLKSKRQLIGQQIRSLRAKRRNLGVKVDTHLNIDLSKSINAFTVR